MSAQASLFRISLVGLLALAVAMGIGRFAFTPLLPLMQDDGLATVSDGGFLAAVHFVGYLLGALFAAKLPGSPKAALQLSLIAIGIGTLGMGVTDNFAAWLFFRWLCGVCSAFSLVLVSNYYVKHLAAAGAAEKQGWVFAGVGAGIAAAGLATLIFMVESIGSALAWQILGAGSLILVVALCLNMGTEIPNTRTQSRNDTTQRSPLHWRMVIAYGTMGFGYIIPATYLPVMAREIIESPIVFGWSWPVFGIAAFASTVLAARLERRFTTRQIWIVSQFVMAAGLLLPTLYPNILMINIAGLSVGGTFMIITMAGMKEAHRIAPADDVMRHIAAMTVAFAAGQMIGPLFGSAIYGATQSFTTALVLTSVALVATAIPLIANARHASEPT